MGDPTPDKEAEEMQAATAPSADDLDVPEHRGDFVKIGTQIRATTRRRLRRLAADGDEDLRDLVDEALHRFLKERGF